MRTLTELPTRLGPTGRAFVESLETRMLLAFAVNVNFQPPSAITPLAYVADSGEKYGNRGNGLTYGWDSSNTTTTRDRDPNRIGPDEAEDTFIHLQKPSSRDAVWEIAVPNGWYEVKAVSGDAWYFNSVFRLDVEGMLAVNGTPSSNTRWLDGTVKVNVTDGKLTVRSAAGAQNNKLCSLQIAEVSTAPAVAKIVGYNAGVRDDAMFLQAAINNLPAGGTLVLEPRTYVLNRGLVINKPIRIEGQNATLTLNTRSWPENQTLRIDSKLSTTSYKWTGAIAAGATTLSVRIPTTDLKAGDMIWVGLGQDPNDPYEEHYAAVCRVVANTGTTVTIDTPVPRNINQGTKQHVIRKVTSLAENVVVRNLRRPQRRGREHRRKVHDPHERRRLRRRHVQEHRSHAGQAPHGRRPAHHRLAVGRDHVQQRGREHRRRKPGRLPGKLEPTERVQRPEREMEQHRHHAQGGHLPRDRRERPFPRGPADRDQHGADHAREHGRAGRRVFVRPGHDQRASPIDPVLRDRRPDAGRHALHERVRHERDHAAERLEGLFGAAG
jgi:hypothetical protein